MLDFAKTGVGINCAGQPVKRARADKRSETSGRGQDCYFAGLDHSIAAVLGRGGVWAVQMYCGLAAVLSLVESYESSSLFGMLSYVHVGLRGRAGMRGFLRFWTAFAGDAGSSIQWLRDVLSAVRRGAGKGPRKCCIFPKSDALLEIGVLTREKKGEKRCESSASQGMHHFVQKIGPKAAAREAPRERVFELILAAKSVRKCGCSRLVVC